MPGSKGGSYSRLWPWALTGAPDTCFLVGIVVGRWRSSSLSLAQVWGTCLQRHFEKSVLSSGSPGARWGRDAALPPFLWSGVQVPTTSLHPYPGLTRPQECGSGSGAHWFSLESGAACWACCIILNDTHRAGLLLRPRRGLHSWLENGGGAWPPTFDLETPSSSAQQKT